MCLPDSTFALPFLVGLAFLLNVEVSAKGVSPTKFSQKVLMNLFRLLSVAMIPIASFVPSAVALYWAMSGISGLAVNLALMSPSLRRAVRIPPTPQESKTPYKDLADNVTNKILRR